MQITLDAASEFTKAMAMSYAENIYTSPSPGSYILVPLPRCFMSLGGRATAVPMGTNTPQ